MVPATSSDSGINYFPFETIQLTKEALSRLNSRGLTDRDMASFDFKDSTAITPEARVQSPKCKAYPGTKDWPSEGAWHFLGLLSGGAL